MALTIGTNSWISLSDAETFFSEHIGAAPWDALADDATKEKYLISAYRWVATDPMFDVPAASDSQNVKYGQCEAALFLINHYEEYQKRDAMQAAGITKFNYSEWHEYLGELTKPRSVVNYFTSAGFYSGGVAMTILKDPAILT